MRVERRKYFLRSGLKRAIIFRLLAKLIDLLIVAFCSFLFYPVGVLLSLFYLGISDHMRSGQSLGKRVMGFSVISLDGGGPCTLKQSIVRNLPILIPWAFILVPFVGWILAFLLGVPLVGLELYLIIKINSGHRLGDVMADTSVVGQSSDPLESQDVIPSSS